MMHRSPRSVRRSTAKSTLLAIVAALVAAIAVVIGPTPSAFAGNANVCYVVADSGGGNGGDDLMFSVDKVTGARTTIGTGTGTFNIEAAEYDPYTDRLLAADANRLGTISYTTGVWSPLGAAFGTGNGSVGAVAFTDVDSLAIDPFSGAMYGVHRRAGAGEADALFRINPSTGVYVPGVFAGGADYVLIQIQLGLADIDDLGISSLDGLMRGVANNSTGDHMVQIDRFTGATIDLGRFRVGGVDLDDVEGFSSDSQGTLWATHGRASYDLYRINPTNAVATVVHAIPTGGDHESVACLTAPPNQITGTVFNDTNGNGVLGGEPGTANVTVRLYRDTNGNGVVDGGDSPVSTRTTDSNGNYSFAVSATGKFVVEIDTSGLPAGHLLTTDNVEVADFGTSFGLVDSNNNFGWAAPATIGDLVWDDLDGDGIRDGGEPGIVGVGLTATYFGPDGIVGNADDLTFTTSTTTGGAYSFTGLRPGTYSVAVTDPVGHVLTTANDPRVFTVVSGASNLTVDFGFYRPATVGDRVWIDTDGDGVQDVGEPGLAGATVTLNGAGTDGIFGNGDDTTATTTTADGTGALALGEYRFTGVAPGTYRVTFDLSTAGTYVLTEPNVGLDVLDSDAAPEGATAGTTASFTIISGDTNPTFDAGGYELATIGDLVFEDLDGNGLADDGATGIGGVTVHLYLSDGTTLVASTTTAADGSYSFSVAPGSYVVDVDESTMPSPVTLTTANEPLAVTVQSGSAFVDGDFGYRLETDLSVTKTDSADPVADTGSFTYTVTATNNGPVDATNVVVVDTLPAGLTFDGAGSTPGCVEVPVGTVRCALGALAVGASTAVTIAVDVVPGTDGTVVNTVTISADQDEATPADNTDIEPTTIYRPAFISDFVWYDIDGDGVQDAGEPGLAAVDLELYDATGTVLLTTTSTDADGLYLFADLAPGTYVVRVDPATLPAGMVATFDAEGATDGSAAVTIASADANVTTDFGYTGTGSIGDVVFEDENGNGTLDPGDTTGIAGAEIRLTWAGPDDTPGTADDVVYPTQTTGATGSYGFADLPAGAYTVDIITHPAGAVLTTANDPLSVSLAAGQAYDEADFGYFYPSTIGDVVWFDLDADTIEDAGESGIDGVDVVLYIDDGDGLFEPGTDDVAVATETTSSGNYDFTGVAPGSYWVDVVESTLPAGTVLTTANDPDLVVVTSGADHNASDFGYDIVASVTEVVFVDADGDGVLDPGEEQAGVDVTFTDSEGTVQTVTTGASGAVTVSVAPGTVTIDIDDTTLPAGVVLTVGTDPTDITAIAGTTTTDTTGYEPQGDVAEIVFRDANGNGSLDPGEALPGVDVEFTIGATTTTITTDATGTATLTGVLAGTTVTIDIDDTTLPAGVVLTVGTDPTDITAAAGTTTTDTTGYRSGSGIRISKTPATQDVVSGGTATFTITIENIGTTTLTDVTVTDPGFAQCDGFFATLAIGGVQSYSCDITAVTTDFTNVADVEATDPLSDTLTDSDSADVTVLTPSFTVAKDPAFQQIPVNGDADFTITITNTGETDLTDLVIDDPLATCVTTNIALLVVGATRTVDCTTSSVTADFTNTVTVTAEDPIGTVLTEGATADVVVVTPDVSITKDPTNQTVVTGGTATFTITVENTGQLDLTNVTVTDPLAPGCDRTIGALSIGATFGYSCTLTGVTTAFTNTADVAASDIVGNVVTDSDTADVVVIAPAITIDKTPDLTYARAGDTVTFSIVVTNTGDVDLTDVVVTDALTPACDVTYATLAVGEAVTSTCSTTATADFTNVAVVVADEPTGGTVGDSDDADVDVIAPAITIAKGPGTQQVIVNGSATFTISISNAGDSPLADVVVSDPLAPDCDTTLAGLDVGETVSYSCTLTGVTTGFTNTADVTADDLTGQPVTDSDTADVTVVVGAVEIQKTPDLQTILAGSTATFDITVTNSGPIDLTGVAITDPLTPACDTIVGALAAGASTTITCTSAAIPADFTNVATVDASDAVGNPYTDTDDALVDVVAPGIALSKTPDLQTVVTGGTATFTITVTNTGDTDLAGVVISDPSAPACDRTLAGLTVAETFSFSCTLAGITADFTNTADVVADEPSGGTVADSDSADVTVLVPSIEIQKTPDTQLAGVGDDVTFTITVTNTGETDLTGVTVTDALVPACDLSVGDLAIGASSIHSCTATGVTGDFTNTASVTGNDPLGNPVGDSDTAAVDVIAPAISISKTPDLQTLLTGETADFTITVTNTGDTDLTDVTVTDALAPDCDATFAVLAAGDTETINCSVTGVTADFTNVASVTADTPLGDTVTDDDAAFVDIVSPGVEIQKTPDLQQVYAGDDAVFTITVTNTGDQALLGLLVDDPAVPACDAGPFDLPVGGSTNYSCTATGIVADFTNIASVDGIDDVGTPVSDSDDAAVDVIAPGISISKTPDLQTVVSGGTAMFTVVVRNTGDVDLTDVVISDPAAPGCDDTVAILVAGATHTTTCSVVGVTADFTNVATVTADDPIGAELTATDDGAVTVLVPSIEIQKTPDLQAVALGDDVTFTITVTNTGQTALTAVTVSDPLAPDCDRILGLLGIGETQVYTCDLAAPTADFTNTASVTGNDPLGNPTTDADTADVDVIAPALSISKTPDLQSVPLGGTATFTVQVTNSGDVDLTDVVISDPLAPGCDATVGTLAVGDTTMTTCTMTVTGDVTNVASVTAVDPNDASVDGGNDSGDVVALLPAVLVEKTPDIQAVGVGQDATFTITVSNVGDVALTSIDVVDTLAPGCDATVGPLVPGESATYVCTMPDVLVDVTNTVDATAVDGNGNVVTSTDSADVTVLDGSISITKTPAAATVVDGGVIVYTITIENTGPADLTNVVVTDPTLPACDTTLAGLLVGERQTWTCSDTDVDATLGDPVVNTVTVVADDEAGTPVTATSTSTVDVLVPGLTVTKTATPSLVTEGGTAVFRISVTNSGQTPLTDVVVTDAAYPTCDITYAALAVGQTRTSTCTIDDVVADITNTVDVIATDPIGGRLDDRDTATVTVIHTGDLTGFVFTDEDRDGVYEPGDGDAPVSDVDVVIRNSTGSSIVVRTDPTGTYRATVVVGRYTIDVDETDLDFPTGYPVPTTGTDGQTVTVDDVRLTTAARIGYGPELLGAIVGTLWHDLDSDGLIDAGEPLLSGVVVTATGDGPDGRFGTADDIVRVTTTDNGEYRFESLPVGSYRIAIEPATLPPGVDIATFDLDGVLDGKTTVTVRAGETTTAVDFGQVGSSLPPDSPLPDTEISTTPRRELPHTGAESQGLARSAFGLMLVGFALMALGRRRRRTA